VERPAFPVIDDLGRVQSLVTFAGANFYNVRNQEYGGFIQDRLAVNAKLQFEMGLRYDRERVVGRDNFAPRAGFSFLPFGTARSKVSGGVGLFYDNLTLISLQLPHLQRRFTTIYTTGIATPAQAATDAHLSPELR